MTKKQARTPRPGPIDKHRPPMLKHFDMAPALTIDPLLIARDHRDCVGALVLALALFFNDLKGMITTSFMLQDALRQARTSEQTGQLHGMIIQQARWTMGLMHELIVLLGDRGQSAALESSEFGELLHHLHEKSRLAWDTLKAVAFGNEGGVPELRKALVRCRNVIAFHYDPTTLARGLARAFNPSSPRPDVAIGRPAFSDGDTMEGTRFFFMDAAVRAAPENWGQATFDELWWTTNELSALANTAIKPLIMAHIRRRSEGRLEPHTRGQDQ